MIEPSSTLQILKPSKDSFSLKKVSPCFGKFKKEESPISEVVENLNDKNDLSLKKPSSIKV